MSRNYVITISRQLGCGGAYLGLRLAERLGIEYLDREIVQEISAKLELPEHELFKIDEKASSFWSKLIFDYDNSSLQYVPPKLFFQNQGNLFEVQSEIIKKMAEEKSFVMIGRGGNHIFKNSQNHLSIFLHANNAFRVNRIKDLYQVPRTKAIKMMEKYDEERSKYIKQISGQQWTDSKNYHLSIDIGVVGLKNAEEIIVSLAHDKFKN